jgi:hypothetical protein
MIVVLSPHLDDAVLSLWHLLEDEGDLMVLNVFGGAPAGPANGAWWDRLTGAEDPAERVAERHAEDRAALGLAGREPVDLGLLDGQYRSDDHDPQEVVDAIAAAVPEGVLLAPAALDLHRSHVAVRDAALRLRARGREVALYADVPHATVYGGPAWVTGSDSEPYLRPEARWAHAMAATGIELPAPRAEVTALAPEALERKRRAVGEYRTQVPALDAQYGVLRPEILAFEVIWWHLEP